MFGGRVDAGRHRSELAAPSCLRLTTLVIFASTQRLSSGLFPLSPLRRRAHPLHQERGVVTHHFTVDVEEYFHVSAFESRVRRADWDRYESRVTESVFRLLDLLARHQARSTFF